MVKPAPQRSRHLAPGDRLGKYEVIRQIAIGGMAELYLARTSGIEGFEKLVVIKRILPQYVESSNFISMFLNEARIAATLHHANIAQVYDIGLDSGDYFFSMEYIHGEDLDHISMAAEEQGVPISLDAALTLVAGLCAGLHYAHEKAGADGKPLQIVHRDVSPSNVLVSYDGSVKLVDFGIARAASRPGHLTNSGSLKGKIAYMSPEQCRARSQLDRRSDIYAVGTILYELTTGQLPFSGETEYQILNQIVNDDARPPSSIVPDYPPALERIVLHALARDPDERYATALQLQTNVEDFAHEMRLRISPLVLARLMGTLFPARLEEWDHAKAQGAFFVEQHVVRTLIESGKTPDPEARAELAAALAAHEAAAERANREAGDDDTTAVNSAHFDETHDTTVGAPAMGSYSAALPIPAPPVTEQHVVVPAPPEPRKPTPYPGVRDLIIATPGSLVTATTSYGADVQPVSAQVDVTERVRVKRHSSPTTLVRAPSRKPFFAILGLIIVSGAIAAAIVLRPSDEPRPASAPPEVKQMPVSPPAVEPAEPVEPVPPPVEAPVEAPPPPPPPAPVAATPAKKPVKVVAKKPPPKKAEPKPEPKPEPKKEQPWDADSPFMPVRTDKR